MMYRIYPSIGIARLGEDPEFFLGPEIPGAGPGELQADGSVRPVTRFKDATHTKIRKQGARFHLFESVDGKEWRLANLPPTATVTWSVTLTNKKSAVERPGDPPISPIRPKVPAANQAMVIHGGTKTISGPNADSGALVGKYATTAPDGSAYQVDVELGRLRTDNQGRLIVLGGKGFSSAPPHVRLGPAYYRNSKWHDDVADGPVTAEIRLAPGAAPITADGGAWVIVAPPDYAPGISGVVTLYDVLRDVAIGKGELPQAGTPSFDLDIAPLIERVRRLRWVHDNANWSDQVLDSAALRSRAAADRLTRARAQSIILSVQTILKGHTDAGGPQFRLRKFQTDFLQSWVDGNFDDTPAQAPTQLSAVGLTRAALEGAVGQGFCPGIEAGIIVLDPTLYRTPFDFRIDHASVKDGDLTALMAQPWQADFLKCNTEWWPTQRPDIAFKNNNNSDDWIRGIKTHEDLVANAGRLGFIVRQGAGAVFLESERDPNLPTH